MAFDLATAKPVGAVAPPPGTQFPDGTPDPSASAPPARKGFDLSTAKPVGAAPPAQPGQSEAERRATAMFSPMWGYTRAARETDPAERTRLERESAQQIGDFVESIPAGVNKGVAVIAGIPADAVGNVTDLGGMAYGATRALISGRPAGEFYTPLNRGGDGMDGASATGYGEQLAKWLDAGAEKVGAGPVTRNPNPESAAGRLGYSLGQALPGAFTGRQIAASGVGGVAQGYAAELGADPATQAILGLVSGKAGEGRGPRPPRPQPPVTDAPDAAAPQLTTTGAPRMLPREPEAPPQRALSATGAPRTAMYTELEGTSPRNPPRFAEETPVADGGRQLGLGDQARRKDILRRIGVGELRRSAVQGDAKAAATDYQMSKLDSPQGQHLARVIDAERQAVSDFAERLVVETGGTRGAGQTENLQRGQNIVAPLDGIKDFFDQGINRLYKIADQRAKGRPFDTRKVREIIGDESEFLGTVEGEALLRGVKARMRSLGMISKGADETPQRTTVERAERLKQYLGDQWTPRTSRLIKRLKEAIDDDVMSMAGEDIYARARALRAERARILDDPQGIAKIMDAEGPQGINRAVAVERVGDVITTIPVAQFAHIVKTLNEAPAALRGQAQAALAEIKSQFATKIFEIGNKHQTQWNARGVSKYLNDNSARLRVVFTPEELRRFADLNDAGHILRFDSSYPGAAVQHQNLKRAAAVEYGAVAAGTALGSAAGPFGAAVGAGVGKVIGDKVGGRIRDRAGLRAAQARTMDLRTEPQNALAGPPARNALRRDEE